MPVNVIAVYGPEALDARLNIMQPVMRVERQSVLWPLTPRVLRMETAIIVSADPLRPQPPKYRREVEFCGPNMTRPPLPSRRRKVKISHPLSLDSGTTKMLGLHLSQQARSSPANVMVLVGYQDSGSAHGAAVLRGPF